MLRLAGIVSTRLVGTARPSRLREFDLEQGYPDLAEAILNTTPGARLPADSGI
jgi:hypothetical protein